MMSVSVAGIPKNRCRTTVAERTVETRAELPFTGDQVGLFRARPGRPKRTCNRSKDKHRYRTGAEESLARWLRFPAISACTGSGVMLRPSNLILAAAAVLAPMAHVLELPSTLPSRPGELHPEPLTDPDLILSHHPARATVRRLPPSVACQVPPVAG